MEFKKLIDEETLQKRIKEMAKEIDNQYNGEELIAICVLKGAAYFAIDLTKNMKTPLQLEFVRTTSYEGTESTGKVKLLLDTNIDLKDKNVLIVEDIMDTGYTLNFLKNYMLQRNPKDLKIAVLCDKKERREVDVDINYTGFNVPNKFLVGYGFDDDNMWRNLPYVGYKEI